MRFRITGLPVRRLPYLFRQPIAEPAASGPVREIADARNHDDPCRISLTDSKRGSELVPVNGKHHAVDSTYRVHFASYMSKAEQNYSQLRIPEHLSLRTLAVWGFDSMAMIAGFELIEGRNLKNAIERLLATPRIAYLHIYVAQPARYAARVERG